MLCRNESSLDKPGPGVRVLVPPVARNLMCKAPMPSSYSAEAQPSSTLKLMLSRQEWAGADPVEAVLPLLAASRDVLRCKHRSLSASSWVLVLPFTLRNREPFLCIFTDSALNQGMDVRRRFVSISLHLDKSMSSQGWTCRDCLETKDTSAIHGTKDRQNSCNRV